jgi:hypothetical protein
VKNSNIISNSSGQEAREARFAYRIAARLNERAESLDGAARTAESRSVVGISASGAALLAGSRGWWVKLASVLPLLALAAGLLLIEHLHQTAQISVAAEIDAELLADDLPPAAYSDAGFVEFLKTPRE